VLCMPFTVVQLLISRLIHVKMGFISALKQFLIKYLS